MDDGTKEMSAKQNQSKSVHIDVEADRKEVVERLGSRD